MAKIKNDPSKYVKRSHAAAAKKPGQRGRNLRTSGTRADQFLTAPIDEAFYIDFRVKPKRAS
jgi:hypothetical protein